MRPITSNLITQGIHGRYKAVDYSSSPDPIAYAPEDVTFHSYANAGDCGNNLQVNGKTGRHGFCHVEETYILPGQKVKKGKPLFKMGYNGLTIPAGPAGRHAHWVLLIGNTYVYPPSKITEPFGGGKVKAKVKGANMAKQAQELKYLMRILNSEAKGWDLNKTHKGQYDTREVQYMTALIDKYGLLGAVTRYAQQAWNEGGVYRNKKSTLAKFYATYKHKISELSARPSKAQFTKLGEELASARKDVETAERELREAQEEAEVLQQEKADAMETGNRLVEWLGRLFGKNKEEL